MKIASWNINSLRVRLDHVCEWLAHARPDILGLQETKVRDDDFPADAFAELGYGALYSGQAAYNGVALLARDSAIDIGTELGGFVDEQRRVLAATVGDYRVLNLYVPNGRHVESDKFQYKLRWLEALRRHLVRELSVHDKVVVMGDFNIAPEDRDVHDPIAWEGKVLCSDQERTALRHILDCGFHDTFRLFEQADATFSWWDYRQGAFRRNRGLRIDLVLASEALRSKCTASRIEPEPRRWERPSDHAPVIAEFAD
jgi:exodeoxyribonuclease III